MIEKYSVDKQNDSIEKRAKELIKTGECISLSDARRVAVLKKGKEDDEQQL
jgi:hypothetical protein